MAQNFTSVVDKLEKDGEEIVVVRNRRAVVRLIPESRGQNAMEMFGDLSGILSGAAGQALSDAVKKSRTRGKHTLRELRNPWAS